MRRKFFKLHRAINKLPHKWWFNKLPKKHFTKNTFFLVFINAIFIMILNAIISWKLYDILYLVSYINIVIVILKKIFNY